MSGVHIELFRRCMTKYCLFWDLLASPPNVCHLESTGVVFGMSPPLDAPLLHFELYVKSLALFTNRAALFGYPRFSPIVPMRESADGCVVLRVKRGRIWREGTKGVFHNYDDLGIRLFEKDGAYRFDAPRWCVPHLRESSDGSGVCVESEVWRWTDIYSLQ